MPVDENGNPLADGADGMMKVKSVQKKWRDSFSTGQLEPANWDSSNAAGGSIAVAGGQLTIGSGVNANAETWILSKETFTVPFRVSIGLTLSQRIVNQSFYVEAVSVDPATGIPDGRHCASLIAQLLPTQRPLRRQQAMCIQSPQVTPMRLRDL